MPKNNKTPITEDSADQLKREMIREAVISALDSQVGAITDVRSDSFKKKVDQALSNVGRAIMRRVPNPARSQLLPARYEAFKTEVGYQRGNYQYLFDPPTKFSEVDVQLKGKKIATYQVEGSPEGTDPKAKKYIINFNGNATFALQTHSEMARDAKTHGCTVLNFDYPGVGDSEGVTKIPSDMVDAGYQQVRRLLDMGVPPENILLKGQSIGSGIATLVAAKCHEEGDKVYLFNQRSFAKMSRVVKDLLGGGVLGSVASGLIKALDWTIDALAGWKKIPDTHKDFCVAAKDRLIRKPASLAKGIGREDDESRMLDCGHNDPLYGPKVVKTVDGRKASDIFDDFARAAFNGPRVVIDQDQKRNLENGLERLREMAADLTVRASEQSPKRRGLFMSKGGDKYEGEIKVIEKLHSAGKALAKKTELTGSDVAKFQATVSKLLQDYEKTLHKKHWPVRQDDPVVAFANDAQKMAKALEAKMTAPQRERRTSIG